MVATFELEDEIGVFAEMVGGTTYSALLSTIGGFGGGSVAQEGADRRTIRFDIIITASTVAQVMDKYRDLEALIARAAYRHRTGHGTQIKLVVNLANTTAEDMHYQVKGGHLTPPASVVDAPNLTAFSMFPVTVTLFCERLAELDVVTLTTGTLENEVDGNANYIDYSLNPESTGRGGANRLLQLQVARAGATAWNGSKKIWVATRSGERYDDVLWYAAPDSVVDNADDPVTSNDLTVTSTVSGGLTTNASGGSSAILKWDNTGSSKTQDTVNWKEYGYFQFDISTLPKGQFRVLARVSNKIVNSPSVFNTELAVGLGYVFGSVTKTPSSGATAAATGITGDWRTFGGVSGDEWNIRDLGILDIPPNATPETTYTDPTLNLRIHVGMFLNGGQWSGSSSVQVELDHIFLLPIDENAIVVSSVSDTDEIVVDSFSDIPAVYLVDSSDVVQKFATASGNYRFILGPEENVRVMWLRDDTGDPTNIVATLTAKITGQGGGV